MSPRIGDRSPGLLLKLRFSWDLSGGDATLMIGHPRAELESVHGREKNSSNSCECKQVADNWVVREDGCPKLNF